MISILNRLKLQSVNGIAAAVTALATVAILSMDLGVPYSKSEEKIYTNPLIQAIAVFCVAYEMLQDLSITGVIVGVWLLIKYFKYFKPHLLIKKKIKEE